MTDNTAAKPTAGQVAAQCYMLQAAVSASPDPEGCLAEIRSICEASYRQGLREVCELILLVNTGGGDGIALARKLQRQW